MIKNQSVLHNSQMLSLYGDVKSLPQMPIYM